VWYFLVRRFTWQPEIIYCCKRRCKALQGAVLLTCKKGLKTKFSFLGTLQWISGTDRLWGTVRWTDRQTDSTDRLWATVRWTDRQTALTVWWTDGQTDRVDLPSACRQGQSSLEVWNSKRRHNKTPTTRKFDKI
jgi:hypothetical protein